jgi:transcriptional regulator with XRE-family HTH domain
MDRFRFGRSVRELGQRRHWRQSDLGDRIGVSRSVIGRIERGAVANVPYGRLLAVADALDGRLDLDFRWRGEALDRLVDERHAAIVDELVGLFQSARWDVAVEVTFSIYGERGSIDVFAFHPIQRVLAVNEVKASVGEAGNTVVGVDRKSRLAPQIASGRGWPCRGVARFLVVADSSTSRDRIARHADTFRTAFPAGGRECLAWIRDPVGQPPSGILFLAPRNGRRVSSATRRGRAMGRSGEQSRSLPGAPRDPEARNAQPGTVPSPMPRE